MAPKMEPKWTKMAPKCRPNLDPEGPRTPKAPKNDLQGPLQAPKATKLMPHGSKMSSKAPKMEPKMDPNAPKMELN